MMSWFKKFPADKIIKIMGLYVKKKFLKFAFYFYD